MGRAYSAWMPRSVFLAFLGLAPQAVISRRGFAAPHPFETTFVVYHELPPYDSTNASAKFLEAAGELRALGQFHFYWYFVGLQLALTEFPDFALELRFGC